MSVNTLMTKEVVFVKASDRVNDAWVLLMEKGITGAPVVNDAGGVVGVLSTRDIYRNIIERYTKARSLRNLMGKEMVPAEEEKEEIRELSLAIRGVVESYVFSIMPKEEKALTISSEDSIERAIHMMAEHSANMIPVVKEGRLVGVISRQDIIWLMAGRPGKQKA